jgi:aminoglycoside phosphotransferase (APT) family kinase protein
MPDPTVKPELEISPDQAQAIVDRMAAGRTVAFVSPLQGGEISAIYEIGLIGAPSLVLKVYPESLHWKMQKEVFVSGLLQDRLSVPAPRILFADDTKSLIDLNFTVMDKLDGDILRGLAPTLTAEQLQAARSQMGRALREIHRVPMESFGYIGPTGVWTAYPTNRAFLSSQFEQRLAAFAEHGGDAMLGGRLKSYIAERAQLMDACATASLCHFDFHSGNILAGMKDGSLQLSGILDFENAIACDPLMDVAQACYYFTLDDETKQAALFAGYGPIDRASLQDTLALYRLYCIFDLWCWFAQTGNHERLPRLARDLERFGELP